MSMVRADAIDKEAVLRALNINVRDPKHQAMLLICERYNLDPVLKHVVLISGNAYVTRDGLLHVAHQTGMLDGIVVEDETETDAEWQAKVTVYVKGQTHGYTYRGRYPKSGQQKRYGAEMAVKCAEVMALRRAFGVTGIPTVEEQWDKADAIVVQEKPALKSSGGGDAGRPSTADVASPGVPAPDREVPTAPPVVEPVVSHDDEVGTAPPGGSPLPGGNDAAGGRSAAARVAPEPPPAPSGDVPTLADLDASLPTNKWNRNKVLREARRIAKDTYGLQHPPADFESLANPEFARLLADMCEAVGVTVGKAAGLTDKQRKFMHAVWAKHGGDNARKAEISRLTSGRTDSTKDLDPGEVKALMDLTAALDGKEATA